MDKISTAAQDVYDSFESSFRDKVEIPDTLKLVWLKKAVARYSVELDTIEFDDGALEFTTTLNQYAIDTLAAFMKQSYQEREVSRVNKHMSIVGKDISIDGKGYTKTAAKNELDYCDTQSELMIANQKPTAYS